MRPSPSPKHEEARAQLARDAAAYFGAGQLAAVGRPNANKQIDPLRHNGRRPGITWTPEMVELLKQEWAATPMRELVQKFRCSSTALQRKASELGLTAARGKA